MHYDNDKKLDIWFMNNGLIVARMDVLTYIVNSLNNANTLTAHSVARGSIMMYVFFWMIVKCIGSK
jgi:hypothetical protein